MLERAGASFERQKGSHQRWVRYVNNKPVYSVLQSHDPVRRDVYESVRKQLRISKKQWKQLYSNKSFDLRRTFDAGKSYNR